MQRRWAIFLVLLLTAACNRHRGSAGARSLVLLLDVPAHVAAGAEVPVAVTLVNRGADTARVALRNATLGLRIETDRGAKVSDQAYPTTLSAVVLTPRGMRGTGFVWDQHAADGDLLSPGAYRMKVAVELRDGKLESEWKPFVVDAAPAPAKP
jgi:hypothetical protein